jgi:hypothetical protein
VCNLGAVPRTVTYVPPSPSYLVPSNVAERFSYIRAATTLSCEHDSRAFRSTQPLAIAMFREVEGGAPMRLATKSLLSCVPCASVAAEIFQYCKHLPLQLDQLSLINHDVFLGGRFKSTSTSRPIFPNKLRLRAEERYAQVS